MGGNSNSTSMSKRKRSLENRGAVPLDFNTAINMLYAVENPRNKNVGTNTVRSFDDGWAPTIGAGVASTSGANPKWFTGKPVNKKEVDNFAVNHLRDSDRVIRQEYDKQFGTPNYPNPSDTLSQVNRLLVAQNRYQRGSLGKGTNSIMKALARGHRHGVVQAVTNNTPDWDKDRMRRVKLALGLK